MSCRNEVIEEHYRKNRDRRVEALRRHHGDRAEDIVQDSYVRALEYWHTYDQGQPFSAWFSTVLQSRAKEDRNKTSKEGFGLSDIVLGCGENQIDAVRLSRVINSMALGQPMHAEILNRVLVVGEDMRDVARSVHMRYDNIRKIVSRFRQELDDA
jgi:DNA-directed RNA polymerase specialized sigma24 family protein